MLALDVVMGEIVGSAVRSVGDASATVHIKERKGPESARCRPTELNGISSCHSYRVAISLVGHWTLINESYSVKNKRSHQLLVEEDPKKSGSAVAGAMKLDRALDFTSSAGHCGLHVHLLCSTMQQVAACGGAQHTFYSDAGGLALMDDVAYWLS